jgi:uncharacterized protein (TIGR03000 family)
MCHGCYGCGGCFGGIYGTWNYSYPGTVYTVPAAPAEKAPAPKVTPQAKVIIQVPADAQVYFDDTLMKSTSEERAFFTPKLEPGQAYYYNVKAVISRDGQTFEETKRVIVRSGQTVRESFRDTLEAKAKVAPIAPIAPAEITSTVRR